MTTTAAACVIVQPSGWQLLSETGLECSDGSVCGQNVTYARSASCTEPFLELKVVFQSIQQLTHINIDCNSKFIEMYVMRDNLLKYHSTLRGGKTETTNLFSAASSDGFEFKELHIKFLSIKPLSTDSGDAAAALQLTLSQVRLSYSPLAAGAQNRNGSDGGGGGGSGGMDMMGMMALSMGMGMMGPGLGRPGGAGAGAAGGMGMGGGGMPAMLSMALASMGAGAGGGGGGRSDMDVPAVVTSPPVPPPQLSTSTGEASTPITDSGNSGTAPSLAHSETISQQPSARKADTSHRSVGAGAAGNSAERRAPAATTVAGLDASQLASILWTVKGSIVQEMGELLDGRLQPVLARLDRMEGRIGALSNSVAALGRGAATSEPSRADKEEGAWEGEGAEAPLQHEVD